MDEKYYEKMYQANVKLVDENSTLKEYTKSLERRIDKVKAYLKNKINEYGVIQLFDGGIELFEILEGDSYE